MTGSRDKSLAFNEVAGLRTAVLSKKTPVLVFLGDFCENFLNTCFIEDPPPQLLLLIVPLRYRSSHQRSSVKKSCCQKFRKIHMKTPMPESLKKRDWHGCFPVNFVKFLRTPFLQNISGRQLPKIKCSELKTKIVDVLINLRLNIESCFLTETTLLQSYICVINYCRNYYLLAAYKFLSKGSLKNNILEFRIYFEM